MSRTGRKATLLWEVLHHRPEEQTGPESIDGNGARRTQRLRYETQCAAITKSGFRCRIRSRAGSAFCPFHDPAMTQERRRQIASRGGRRHHRLSRLPDGYLRKLTSRRAAGEAMDRLYREVRLGVITPEMGSVLFSILTRLVDSGLCDPGGLQPAPAGRSRLDRVRPKLSELLTRSERAAWRRAIANAPPDLTRSQTAEPTTPRPPKPAPRAPEPPIPEAPPQPALQFAS